MEGRECSRVNGGWPVNRYGSKIAANGSTVEHSAKRSLAKPQRIYFIYEYAAQGTSRGLEQPSTNTRIIHEYTNNDSSSSFKEGIVPKKYKEEQIKVKGDLVIRYLATRQLGNLGNRR